MEAWMILRAWNRDINSEDNSKCILHNMQHHILIVHKRGVNDFA
jgi:hypothetical protein